uniref:Uncharacterized protein n=1 Tax=viral metagenome TaxID=1070528 RepID=A0A6C0ADG4_9ZZZZ
MEGCIILNKTLDKYLLIHKINKRGDHYNFVKYKKGQLLDKIKEQTGIYNELAFLPENFQKIKELSRYETSFTNYYFAKYNGELINNNTNWYSFSEAYDLVFFNRKNSLCEAHNIAKDYSYVFNS